MKKVWSGFWLVIVSVIAINIIAAMIQPWLPLIVISLVLIVLATISALMFRFIHKRRRFF